MSAPSTRIDRAAHLRKDVDRLMSALDGAETILVPVHESKVLVDSESRAVLPSVPEAGDLVDRAGELVWLGVWEGRDCFALDLSPMADPLRVAPLEGRGEFSDLRMIGGLLPPEVAEVLMFARGMLHWHRHHRHCGQCGRETRPREGGHMRECPDDGNKTFPRTDPAVMMLVSSGNQCVLARQSSWPKSMFSVIAGFVEPGETLEQAATRETKEELGIDVTDVRYFRSQPWPFPASLMLGFFGTTESERIEVDGEEIEEARWFSREELSSPDGFFYPPPFSLAHHLIQAFIRGDA